MCKRYQECLIIIMTLLFFLPVICLSAYASSDSAMADSSKIIARVVELSGPEEIYLADQNPVTIGTVLGIGDTLKLNAESYIVLILQDGSIAKYEGPVVVSPTVSPSPQHGGILAKLSSAIRNIFFTGNKKEEEAMLGVRDPNNAQVLPLRVPRLLYPPSGTNLLVQPIRLTWQPVEGVILYAVSLYGSNKLLWQGETNTSSVDLPSADSPIRPGNDYLWVVEARIGNEFLRSEQAIFSVLDSEKASELSEHLLEIDALMANPKLRHILKAELYRDYGLMLNCYDEIRSVLRISPKDYTSLILQVQLLEEMEYYEDAIEVYKSLLNP